MLGHLAGFTAFHGGSGGKKQPSTKSLSVEGFLGDFLGLCWANVGPFWVYVGPMLGHLGGFMGFHGGLGGKESDRIRRILMMQWSGEGLCDFKLALFFFGVHSSTICFHFEGISHWLNKHQI